MRSELNFVCKFKDEMVTRNEFLSKLNVKRGNATSGLIDFVFDEFYVSIEKQLS